MNIQIINIAKSDKFQDKLKHLSIPSPLYYNMGNIGNMDNIGNLLNKLSCNKNECCIDATIYKNIINNLKPNKEDIKIYNRKKSRRNNAKKLNSKKSRKNKN